MMEMADVAGNSQSGVVALTGSKSTPIIATVLGAERCQVLHTVISGSLVVDSDTVAWVALNRQDKSVNVEDLIFLQDMDNLLSRVETLISTKKVRAVCFYSEKSTFIAGADIKSMYPVVDPKIAPEVAKAGQKLFDRIENLPVPTIAAINGSALGGGLELALACAYRISASAPSIQIGLPEVKLGLLPGGGGTIRLPKLVGMQNAMTIILPGGAVNPAKAKKLGIVDRVIDSVDRFPGENRWLQAVRSFATSCVDKPVRRASYSPSNPAAYVLERTYLGRRFMANMAIKNLDKTTKGKYPAPYRALDCIYNSYRLNHSKASQLEAHHFGQLLISPESKNLMGLFFLTEDAKKLMAQHTASLPKLNKIGVVGAGVMGSGIAQLFASKNYQVYMKDIKPEFVSKGLQTVASLFAELVKKQKFSKEEGDRRTKLVTGGVDNRGFSECQVIVEAAVERMDLKKRVLQDVEKATNNSADVIFATNTSSLSINELANSAVHPENIVGMHFFNPVHKMPLVEVIRGNKTSDRAVAMIYQLSLALGKIPVIVNDGPGFLVNRILGAYMGEAGRLLAEGGDILAIDRAIVDFGMPMGPFRLMDEVGLDVAFHVAPILEKLGPRFASNPAIGRLVSSGLLGKKSGKGFYVYADGKNKGLNPDLAQLLASFRPPTAPRTLSIRDIVDRCILSMVNEAAYILQEGIADRPEDVDLGMVMGTGFAPFRGGLCAYADDRGHKNIVARLNELSKHASQQGATPQASSSRFAPARLLVEMAESGKKFLPNRPLAYTEGRAAPRPRL